MAMQRQPLKSDDGVQRTRTVNTVDPSKVEKKTQTAPSSPPNKCGKCGGNHPTKTCTKQPANPKLGASKPPARKNNVLPKGVNNAANNSKITKRMSGRRGK